MTVVGLALLVLAAVLAWPVPVAIAASQQRHRRAADPVASIIVWQAVGLAGGFSLISACIAFALAPLLSATSGPVTQVMRWWHWVPLVAGLGLLLLLLASLAWEARKAQILRTRHREALALVSSSRGGQPETRVIDTDHAIAYSVAGGAGTTVISTGLLQLLTDDEREAVLAHERQHLHLRHNLLTLPFASWHRTLPLLPATSTALESVSAAIEIMADDAARRTVSEDAFVRALTKVADGQDGSTRHHDVQLTNVRIERLSRPLDPDTARPRIRASIYAVCLAAVPPLILIGTIVYS